MSKNEKSKPLAEMVLIGEIVFQAKLAEKAAEQLSRPSDMIDTWACLQSILIAAANVSKILWPARKECLARGKELRDMLGVSDDHFLADRSIRNHFEHYDERIEEWFKGGESAVYMDLRIDSRESTPLSPKQIFHRSYNPTTQLLSFRNESISIAAIHTVLAEIREKCRSFVLV